MAKKASKKENIDVSRLSFFRIFIGMIKTGMFGRPDPIYEKYVLLKKIKKKLQQVNIKGVNLSKNRLTPDFANFLYQIYRYFYPLKGIIDLGKPSTVQGFQDFLIHSVASDAQKEKINFLISEKSIQEILIKEGPKKLGQKLKETYKSVANSFSREQIAKINLIYSLGENFYQFLRFDLFFLLRKFSMDLKEEPGANPPNFREIELNQAEESLKDFADSLNLLNMDANYYEFLSYYGNFIGKEIILQEDFRKFFQMLQMLVKTGYLNLLVQYITNDVFFKPLSSYQAKNVFNAYMKNLVGTINNIQDRASQQVKNQKITQLLTDLFGQANFNETTAYTFEQNEYLNRTGVGSFTYVEPFNVLKKFMMDKYNRYIRKNLHTFILKAGFSVPNFSESMNSLYHRFNSLMEQILEFENKLKGKDGYDRLLTLIRGRSRDSSLAILVQKNINEINKEAKTFLDRAIEFSENLKDNLRTVVESYKKGAKEPVANIKSFNGQGTTEVIQHLALGFNDLSKLLAYFKMTVK